MYEIPAGSLDPGEDPLAGAKRELLEETGYKAKHWSKLIRFYASPGFLGEWMQIFLAEGLMPYAGKQAYIYRREASGPKNEIAVSLDKIMKRQAPDVTLTADDILYIPDNSGRRVGLGILEKVLMLGGGATSALIYTLR